MDELKAHRIYDSGAPRSIMRLAGLYTLRVIRYLAYSNIGAHVTRLEIFNMDDAEEELGAPNAISGCSKSLHGIKI